MIFYNLLSENGGIWDSGHENVALRKNKDSESKEEISEDYPIRVDIDASLSGKNKRQAHPIFG